jgi:hypothetical protein
MCTEFLLQGLNQSEPLEDLGIDRILGNWFDLCGLESSGSKQAAVTGSYGNGNKLPGSFKSLYFLAC